MEQTATAASSQYYLKGNWRHIFWPYMILYLLSYLVPMIIIYLWQPIDQHQSDVFFVGISVFSIIVQLFFVVILLVYGLKNNVKLFHVIFQVLAVVSVLTLMRYLLISTLPYLMLKNNHDYSRVYQQMGSAIYYLEIVFSIAFFAAIFACKFSNRLLKIASILVMIVISTGFIYKQLGSPLDSKLYESLHYNTDVINRVNLLINITKQTISMAVRGLFFGAMSYSKPKESIN